MTHTSAIPVSYLFVPATRPERIDKALASEAEAVIIDLEDAVGIDEKDLALKQLVNILSQGVKRPVYVRINDVSTPWSSCELNAILELSSPTLQLLEGIIVPKVEEAKSLRQVIEKVHAVQPEVRIIALIESAKGALAVPDLAVLPGLHRFAVGAADLCFDVDASAQSGTVDWVYSWLVMHSRAAGMVAPIASPPFEIKDLEVVRSESRRLRSLGCTAQMSIHPAQIEPIHDAFRASDEERQWAVRVLEAIREKDGAVQVDGQMVDKPIVQRAQRILGELGPGL